MKFEHVDVLGQLRAGGTYSGSDWYLDSIITSLRSMILSLHAMRKKKNSIVKPIYGYNLTNFHNSYQNKEFQAGEPNKFIFDVFTSSGGSYEEDQGGSDHSFLDLQTGEIGYNGFLLGGMSWRNATVIPGPSREAITSWSQTTNICMSMGGNNGIGFSFVNHNNAYSYTYSSDTWTSNSSATGYCVAGSYALTSDMGAWGFGAQDGAGWAQNGIWSVTRSTSVTTALPSPSQTLTDRGCSGFTDNEYGTTGIGLFVGGKNCMTGGSSNPINLCQRYTYTTGSSSFLNNLALAQASMAMFAVNSEQAFNCGGENNSGAINNVFSYEAPFDSWNVRESLIENRDRSGHWGLCSHIGIMVGGNNDGSDHIATTTLYKTSLRSSAYDCGYPSSIGPIDRSSGVSLGPGKGLIVGGRSYSLSYSNATIIYNNQAALSYGMDSIETSEFYSLEIPTSTPNPILTGHLTSLNTVDVILASGIQKVLVTALYDTRWVRSQYIAADGSTVADNFSEEFNHEEPTFDICLDGTPGHETYPLTNQPLNTKIDVSALSGYPGGTPGYPAGTAQMKLKFNLPRHVTSNVWTAMTSCNYSLTDRAGCDLSSGHIIVAGGQNGSGIVGNAEAYSKWQNIWTTKPSDPAVVRSGDAVRCLEQSAVFMHGFNGGGTAYTRVFEYVSNSWATKTPNPYEAPGISLSYGSWNAGNLGEVIVAGGSNGSYTYRSSRFSVMTNAWDTRNNISEGLSAGGAFTASTNNYIGIIAGGSNGATGAAGAANDPYPRAYNSLLNTYTPLIEFLDYRYEGVTGAELREHIGLFIGGLNTYYTPSSNSKTFKYYLLSRMAICRATHPLVEVSSGVSATYNDNNSILNLPGSLDSDGAYRYTDGEIGFIGFGVQIFD